MSSKAEEKPQEIPRQVSLAGLFSTIVLSRKRTALEDNTENAHLFSGDEGMEQKKMTGRKDCF